MVLNTMALIRTRLRRMGLSLTAFSIIMLSRMALSITTLSIIMPISIIAFSILKLGRMTLKHYNTELTNGELNKTQYNDPHYST